MNLPAEFIKTVGDTFDSGQAWLKSLPDLLSYCEERWQLQLGEAFELSFNYVCAATLADGRECVLKVGVPGREVRSEVETLRFYGDASYARLIDCEIDRGVLLLERLRPGRMLSELPDDEASSIAAELLQNLWRPVAEPHPFLEFQDWTKEVFHLKEEAIGEGRPFPRDLVARARETFKALYQDPVQVLLHGDFHHMNILSSGDQWRLIDPKGVVGSRLFEFGAFLHNPYLKVDKAMLARRIAIFSEHLPFERQEIIEAALAQFVLSASWSYPHADVDKVLHLARLLTEL